METITADIIKVLFGSFVSLVIMYVGFINKLRTEVTLLKDKIERLEKRQDSHSKKNDEIINLITSFKMEMIEKFGDILTQIGKMGSDIDNMSKTFEVFDMGIKKKDK